MTARGARCHVCRLAGSRAHPLVTVTATSRGNGERQQLTVHRACGEVLQATHDIEPEEQVTESKNTETADQADDQAGGQADPEQDAGAPEAALPVPTSAAAPPARGEWANLSPEMAELLGEAPAARITDEDVVRFVVHGKIPETLEPSEIAREIMLQILRAEDPEGAANQGELVSAKDAVYRPVTIYGYEWRASTIEGSDFPFWALLDVLMEDTGERTMMDCGSGKVAAQLIRLKVAGRFPYRARFTTVRTSSGYDQLQLEPADQAAPGQQGTLAGETPF